MACREEVLANILHIFSTSTNTSPLASNDNGEVYFHILQNCSISGKSKCHDDKHLMRPSSQCDDRSGIGLEEMWKPLVRAETKDLAVVNKIMSVMIDFSREHAEFGDAFKEYDDTLIWEAGMKLIHHVVSDEKYGTLDDEPISPHILLSTVMDSYYYNDSDAQVHEMNDNEQLVTFGRHLNDDTQAKQLSTSLAMFYLRSHIASFSIEKAVDLTRQSTASSSTTMIRWRRLKSMVEDITSLFKKMLSDHLTSLLAQEIDPSKMAVETMQLITVATSVYAHNIFLTCRNLIELLLKYACKSSSDRHFKRLTLETGNNCIGTLTSLVALQLIFGEGRVASSSAIHAAMNCIDGQPTDNLFQLMLHECDSDTNDDQTKPQKFNLWNDTAVKKCSRGLDLMQDLLLYPSIRLSYDIQRSRISVGHNDDDTDDSSEDGHHQETYDLLGIAIMAYCLSTGEGHISLPYPYSKQYRWSLLFPHIRALLTGLHASSTFNFINDTQLSTLDELNDTYAFELGIEMLDKLMSAAPSVIDPCSQTRNARLKEFAILSCAKILESTIESLLSLVLRLSMFESSICNGSNLKPVKYSSQHVMGMAQTLLELHMPDVRIRALTSLSQKMKSTGQSQVLLPRVLDWMRPSIMKIYLDKMTSSDDIAIVLVIIDALSPFVQDLEFAFDRHKSTRDLTELVSMTEVHVSFVSIYRFIRLWVCRARSNTNSKRTTSNVRMDIFHQIEDWVLECTSVMRNFAESLSSQLDFWSVEGSPKDTTQFDKNDPPSGWHRLFLLLHSLKESLEEVKE
ncbi:hypothetical protein HJC23_002824 [Cyclotella cryptica]|uniref:HEAT repeat-containing protein 1 n=1 Tax=Cyclotella cryptica TaxID=29204 RepID=A0ABD3PNP6_9STRA